MAVALQFLDQPADRPLPKTQNCIIGSALKLWYGKAQLRVELP